MAVTLNKRANSFTNNPLFRGMGKIINDVSKETSKIGKNIVNSTKQVVNNVVQGTKNVVNNVKNEAVKIGKNVGKETSRITGNIVNSTKQITKDAVRATVRATNNVRSQASKVVNNIADKTKKAVRNVASGAKQVVNNVVQGTKNVVNNVKNEAVKIAKNVGKETSRIAGNIVNSTKQVVNNVVQGTKNVVNNVKNEAKKIVSNITKSADDIKKEAEKVVKDVADGMGNTVNSVVKGANNVLGYIKDSVKRDHEMLKNEAKIEEVNKILDGQEKSQKKKSFSEGISGMELGEDTISNRVTMSDSSDRESIYNNFKLGKDFKKGKIFPYGKEEFEILDIVKTKSGMKAVVLGNKNTKGVEIIYEGSTAPTEILKKGGQVLQDWNNNGGGNMRRSRLDLMTGGLSEIVKSPVEGTLKFALRGMYESNENGTPLHYQEALELAKKVQNEYKDGKGGYNKGLTRVSGHSKGGGEAIYTASHLNIEAIATDPAPVNNPGKYLYNNKIIRVVPNNGSGLLNIKPSKAILELSTKVSPYSSKTLSKDKISDEIDKITKNHKTYSVGALVGKQRMDNLPTLEVKAHKEDGLHHKTDYKSVLAKEKEVLNNLKNYKASQNRGR